MTNAYHTQTAAYTEFSVVGVQPPSPGYFSRVAERNIEEANIAILIRMKAVLTLCDVMDALEAA